MGEGVLPGVHTTAIEVVKLPLLETLHLSLVEI